MKLSFVIPCYNSEKNIGAVLGEIQRTMTARPETEYEVILVNDCSRDGTARVIRELAKEDPHIIAVDLAKNAGQANALLAGFHYVSGDYVMTSDDDGQTPVGRVFEFLDKLQEGYDVVSARYTDRGRPPLFRRLGSAVNRGMSDWLIEKPEGYYMSVFFMARRYIVEEMIRYRHPYPYISGLILRATQNVANIDVEQRARQNGSSGYTLKKLLRLWMNGFTAFSVKPLRVSAAVGLALALIGFLTALVTLVCQLALPGFAVGGRYIIASVFFVGGLVLLFLGLVGEYIGRIYMCINDTPQYVVKEVTGYEKH